jgi:hypothetical protein
MHARLGYPQIVFIRAEPFLIRVLQRRGQGRHDLAAVAQVSPDLCPFLVLADLLKSTPSLDGLFQSVEIERFLVDVG